MIKSRYIGRHTGVGRYPAKQKRKFAFNPLDSGLRRNDVAMSLKILVFKMMET
jgi:hypothetical protein